MEAVRQRVSDGAWRKPNKLKITVVSEDFSGAMTQTEVKSELWDELWDKLWGFKCNKFHNGKVAPGRVGERS
jgi:hypothetical protein